MFSSGLHNHWALGDGVGGYLCTNNGIRALFHVIKDIADHIRRTDGTDVCLFGADETFAEIEPYLLVLREFFNNASVQEVQAFRRIGSSLTAVRRQAYGLEAHISNKITDFMPLGLKEYLESRDEAGTEETAAKVIRIHRWLFDYVIGSLKIHYGTGCKSMVDEGHSS